MSDMHLFYWQEQLYRTQPRVLRLVYKITAAKTVAPIVSPIPALVSFDALTQAGINSQLGTTLEFTLAQFDATSMGADMFGGVIAMKGQCEKVLSMKAECFSASNVLVTRQCQALGLADSTVETALALGANGNLGFKVNFGNTPDMDALTSGTIVIEINWISK